MDFTNIKCISEQCKDNNITMIGDGSVTYIREVRAVVKCPECGLKLEIKVLNEPVNENRTGIKIMGETTTPVQRFKGMEELTLLDGNKIAMMDYIEKKVAELWGIGYTSMNGFTLELALNNQ